MGKLSTHVLDTTSGSPARGVKIELFKVTESTKALVKTVETNSDGRTDELLLDANAIEAGKYELHFHVGDYFESKNTNATEPPFLDVVPVCFGIADATQNFHVPLLISPWSYSTYRGS